MKIKIILAVAGALVLWFLYSQFVGLVEDNAMKDVVIESQKKIIAAKEAKQKKLNKLNTQMVINNARLSDEYNKQKERIKKLPLTKQQKTCKRVALPSGYMDGLNIN